MFIGEEVFRRAWMVWEILGDSVLQLILKLQACLRCLTWRNLSVHVCKPSVSMEKQGDGLLRQAEGILVKLSFTVS
jgi:hypothetical protein